MKKMPFHQKLFFSISAVMLFLMTCCISAFSVYTYRNLYNQNMTNLIHIRDRTGYDVSALIQDMDQLALYVSTNSDIRRVFSDLRKKDLSNSYLSKETVEILTSISVPNSSSRFRISLYNSKGNFISIGIPYSTTKTTELLTSPDYLQWYDSLPILNNKASLSDFHPDYWGQDDQTYLSLYRQIFDEKSNYAVNGIIEIQCPYDLVQELLNFEDTSYGCRLYDENGSLVFPADQSGELTENLYQAYEKNSSGGLNTKPDYLYSGAPISNGLSLVMYQSASHIWKIILPQILAVFFTGTGALIIMFIALFYVTKHATKPLRDLTTSVKQVSYPNLSLEMNAADYSDEISGLNRAFDKMFLRLKQSMDENVRRQACEMKANMVALQAQMDPHFLFNTLTVMKALCREQNTRQISLTCDYLVKMLRYISAYDDHMISLRQELNHTENYLKLMQIRYEEQFSYTIFIDSNMDIQSLLVPRLTLQPLVENCFQHGFKGTTPPWKMEIRFWQNNFHWFLSVSDNGAGISPEKSAEINRSIDEFLSHPSDSITSLKIGGMGLINTVARLKLRYKDQISFEIVSQPFQKTQIILGGVIEE